MRTTVLGLYHQRRPRIQRRNQSAQLGSQGAPPTARRWPRGPRLRLSLPRRRQPPVVLQHARILRPIWSWCSTLAIALPLLRRVGGLLSLRWPPFATFLFCTFFLGRLELLACFPLLRVIPKDVLLFPFFPLSIFSNNLTHPSHPLPSLNPSYISLKLIIATGCPSPPWRLPLSFRLSTRSVCF